MRRPLLAIATLALLVCACSGSRRTQVYVPESGGTANVLVDLSNQDSWRNGVTLALYVDDQLVATESLGHDIHEYRSTELSLPHGRHVLRVVGPGGVSATTEIVAGEAPLYVSAAWWEGPSIVIRVQDEPFGYC